GSCHAERGSEEAAGETARLRGGACLVPALVPTLRVGTPLATLCVALAPPTKQAGPRRCAAATRSVAGGVPTQSVGTRGSVQVAGRGRSGIIQPSHARRWRALHAPDRPPAPAHLPDPQPPRLPPSPRQPRPG